MAVGLLLPSAGVNGDGIGYLKQVRGDALSPGHLLYLPLLRLLALAGGDRGAALMEWVPLFRLLSLSCGALSLILLHAAARMILGPRRALLAGVLLATSHAFMRSSMEVESYAPATLACTATLWALVRGGRGGLLWAAAAGILAGVAAGFHSTLILLAPALLWAPRRDRPWIGRAISLAAAGLTLGLILVWAMLDQGIREPGAMVRWLASADHGVAYPHGLRTAPAFLWGLCRSLVHAPYPYEGSLWRTALGTLLAGVAWTGLVWLHRRTEGGLHRGLSLNFLLAWCMPLALFALAFFPSDTERWIFVMPAICLVLAPPPGRLAHGLLALIALINVLTYELPLHLARQGPGRARAAERICRGGDVLVSPGHGWEELVGLGSTDPPEPFPLIHHVGAEGGLNNGVMLMEERITAALAAGHGAYVARLKGSTDENGFKELAWFGMDRQGFARLFERYGVEETEVPELYRLRLASPTRPSTKRSTIPP